MVHTAYDFISLSLDVPVKIESVTLWGQQRVLLGCLDGSLRIFGPDDALGTRETGNLQAAAYKLQDVRVGFSKRAIVQLDAMQVQCLLVSLGDVVAVHLLPELDLATSLERTRGAHLYLLDADRGLLCVAMKKSLLIYKYEGAKEFVEIKELFLPDPACDLAWSGDEAICVAIRREYVLMNMSKGTPSDLLSSGRLAPPLAVSLPNGSLLLGKDNIGIFVDPDGRAGRGGGLSWSEAPSAVAVAPPYVLALLTRYVEVRWLQPPHALVQTLPLRGLSLLYQGPASLALAASTTAVYALHALPIDTQVVALARGGQFEEALALLKQSPAEDRALREDAIHQRYALELFSSAEYEQAMEHFAASSIPLGQLLVLFPWLALPAAVLARAQAPVAPVAPFLASLGRSSSEVEAALAEGAALQGAELARALSALAGYLLAKRPAHLAALEDAALELGGSEGEELLKQKHAEAHDRMVLTDTAALQALLPSGGGTALQQLLTAPCYADVGTCAPLLQGAGAYEHLIALYTATTHHSQALALLRRLVAKDPTLHPSAPPGRFDMHTYLDCLQQLASKDPALLLQGLVWLLQEAPEHALGLLKALDPPLPPPAVLAHLRQYAPHLCATYLEHVLGTQGALPQQEPARLRQAPQQPPVLQAQPSRGEAHLSHQLVQLYLEKVLEQWASAGSQWVEGEVSAERQKLRQALQGLGRPAAEQVLLQLPPSALWEEQVLLHQRLGNHRQALALSVWQLHLPERAEEYCAEVAGAHRAAATTTAEAQNAFETLLEVYLQPGAAGPPPCGPKEAPPLAPATPSRPSAGHSLRLGRRSRGAKRQRPILGGPAGGGAMSSGGEDTPSSERGESEGLEAEETAAQAPLLREALQLLARHWQRFQPLHTLQRLPQTVNLLQLLPFLEPLLCHLSEERRNAGVIKNLRRSDNLQARNLLLEERKRSVKVTRDCICELCKKRLGSSVIAVRPDSTTAHFSCFKAEYCRSSGEGMHGSIEATVR